MSALVEGLHAWRPDAGWVTVDWCDPHEGELLVADSWRVIDGGARGLERHRDRFLAGVSARLPEHDGEAGQFWREAIAALPREGDWFPRVELRARGDGSLFALRLRPTPPAVAETAAGTEVAVATAPRDPRTRPLVKGPDLDALQALRLAVQPSGAGEAVIVDARGMIVEGAYSGLLWWRDETLVQPSRALPRIPSVTVGLVLDAARAAGVTVVEEEARPEDLEGCELWVLSALHGARGARDWIDGPALAAPHRVERACAWLRASIAPLPGSRDARRPTDSVPRFGDLCTPSRGRPDGG